MFLIESNTIATSLLEILSYRAQYQPDQHAYIFLQNGETESGSLTYGELDRQAKAIATHLQSCQGERALLIYPSGLEFITAFFGCLYAGVVAVPVYPPRRNQNLSRLLSIVNNAQPKILLTTTSILADIEKIREQEVELAQLQSISTDTIVANSQEFAFELVRPESLAFLQYTSGSTGTPKGVMVTHGNIIHNQQLIYQAFGHGEKSIGVNWLPLFHDMGLIGSVLQPLYGGFPCILMPPVAFLQKPILWLQAISKYKATTCGGPNFAYDLCVKKIKLEELANIDLSSWDLAFNGAEPVRAETLEQFGQKFAGCGFKYDAFYPCYGMAETTLFTTGGNKNQEPVIQRVIVEELDQNLVVESEIVSPASRVFVGCGRPYLDSTVMIVNPDSLTPCDRGQVGEIWVSGASVAAGYWNRPETTQETFQASLSTGEESFLRTGDLGFFQNDELFVTGRLKDLIIIRGRNHYPQDIEFTVEHSHPALQENCGAAFSIEIDGSECLVVVCEVKRTELRKLNLDQIVAEILVAVSTEHELEVRQIFLLRPGSIPKTSSGKIQRSACKLGVLENNLNVVGEWQRSINKILPTEVSIDRNDSVKTVAEIETWLTAKIAEILEVATVEIDQQQPLAIYGLNSLKAVSIAAELETWLGIEVAPTIVYEYPNIQVLANYLGSTTPLLAASTSSLDREERSGSIAIIGTGCRFPQAANPQAFWSLLKSGVNAIGKVPVSRWESEDGWGGFLEGIDRFDPQFFSISPREASNMDPQQRLLLEVSWEALENASLAASKLAGSQSGVFIGISNGDYARLNGNLTNTETYYATGNALSIAANRLCYFLDWHGPSLAMDTACSSSLVAVHQACQSLISGECNLALAGGINLILSPQLTLTFTAAQMMAADGRCKTFDAAADGYVRSEGCGVVVLKRLADAIADGDNIQAIIRGSAVNQDGQTNGLTAPNGNSQQEVIRLALAKAGVTADRISYVEAHGTGTALGDPIEVNALKTVLMEGRESDRNCWIGSVKTNIGHLEAAAGIAGLIKTVLSLEHGKIPPHLHLDRLNSYIKLEDTPLEIPTQLQSWSAGKYPRLAGVSAFGFGGTNAHLILEEAPVQSLEKNTSIDGQNLLESQDKILGDRPLHLLTLSAKTDKALRNLVTNYQNHLESSQAESDIASICFSANTGRSHFDHRLAILAADKQELIDRLVKVSDEEDDHGIWFGKLYSNSKPPKIAYLFTGQGSQYVNMGRQLYETQTVFRQTIEQCDRILQPYLEMSLLDILYPDDYQSLDSSIINQTAYTQPALFAIEYALFQLWQSWGIKPDVVMGHSVGEYVAATVAGVFSLEDGLKLITHRGRLMQKLPVGGAMVAVMASAEKVNQLIASFIGAVALAAVNGAESVVISGEVEAISAIIDNLELQGIKTKRLQVSHAFHSPLMKPILAEFEVVANLVTYNQPLIPLISNLTGSRADRSIATANYWVNHVSQPVKFAQSIETLHQEGHGVFLEIGPKPTLLGMGRQCLSENEGVWLPSLRSGQEDWKVLLQSLAELHVRGVKVDWVGFDRDYSRRRLVLPTYPFQRQRYWIETKTQSKEQYSSKAKELHPLLGQIIYSPLDQKELQFQSLLSEGKPAYLSQHKVFGKVLFPITAYLEIAMAAGQYQFKTARVIIENLVIKQGLTLPVGDLITVHTILTPLDNQTHQFEIFTKQEQQNKEKPYWIKHASGNIQTHQTHRTTEDLEKYRNQCNQPIDVAQHYQEYQQVGIDYGTSFQGLQNLWKGDNQAIGEIHLSQELIAEITDYHFHPALLDAALQVIGHAISDVDRSQIYLPVGVDRFKLYSRPGIVLWAYASVTQDLVKSVDNLITQVTLLSGEGEVVAILEGLRVKRVIHQPLLDTEFESINNWLYEIEWKTKARFDRLLSTANKLLSPVEIEQQLTPSTTMQLSSAAKSWMLFADRNGVAQYLATQLRERGDVCTLVFTGDRYQQISPEEFIVNPHSSEEFEQLIATIVNRSPSLYGVVNCFSIEAILSDFISSEELESLFQLGCSTTLSLVRALAKRGASQIPRLWLVTKGAQPVPDNNSLCISGIVQSSLWGLSKVIALEHPELKCTRVDLDPNVVLEEQAQALWAEIYSEDAEDQVAIRGQKRYVARLIRQQGVTPTQGELQAPIVSQASYLITGGLGSLGLHLARWMVEQGAKHLVLTGRKQASATAQQTIEQLRKAGAQILVICGDISQARDVIKILEEIKVSLPPLQGVIHAAGLLDDGLLQQMSWEQFTRVMAPKVQGTWHLHTLTLDLPLDFFICFSSIASLLGSPGQGNYAAANAFMDAFAHYRRGMGLPGLSINWGPWAEGGMVASLGNQYQSRMLNQGISPISPEGGLQTLANLLTQDSTQVGVLPVNWSKFMQQFALTETPLLLSEIAAQERSRLETETQPSMEKSELLQRLKQAHPADHKKILVECVGKQVARVLGLDPSRVLDPQQSLSELGLDSLMAIELRNNIEAILKVSLPIVNLLQGASISQLVSEISTLLTVESVNQYPPLVKVSRDRLIPLSSLQERYWFIAQTAIGGQAHLSLDCRIIGPLNIILFEKCINEIIRRHETLRTTFKVVNGSPFQVIHPSFTLQMSVINLQELSEEEWIKEARRLANEQEMQCFDLTRLPLLRATILQRSDEEYVFLLTLHHIVSDIWSMRVLIEEIKLLYEVFTQNKLSPLPDPTIQHADFAYWERQWLQGEKLESLLSFWRKKFGPNLPKPLLPTKHPKSSVYGYCGARQFLTLSKFVTDGLNDLSRKQGVSLFTTLLAAFKTLLYRLTEQDDIFVGSPCANRTKAEFHELIGFFAHLLFLRTDLSGNPTFLELQVRVSEVVYQASEYQDLPTGKLIQELYPDQYLSLNELLQVQFNLLPISYDSIEMSDVTIQPLGEARTKVSFSFFDLNCIVIPKQDELQLVIFYNTLAFEDSFISDTFKHFQNLLEAIVANPEQRILDFPI